MSPCYGPFSLGARFETYEWFISLIFQFFSGRGNARTIETADAVLSGYGGTIVLKYPTAYSIDQVSILGGSLYDAVSTYDCTVSNI
jgi:hypothetical protein